MDFLETAEKVYAKVIAQRNGYHPGLAHRLHPYEKNEINEQRQSPAEQAPRGQRTPGDGKNEINEISTPTPFQLVTDAADLSTVADAIDGATLIGLDLETTGLNPRTARVRLLSLDCDTNDGRFTYLVDLFTVDPSPLWEALATKPLVIHNAAFDLSFLSRLGFIPGTVHDTMLLAQILAARTHDNVSLDAVPQRELHRTLDKTHQKDDWRGGPSPVQPEYSPRDAPLLVPLYLSPSAKITAAQ